MMDSDSDPSDDDSSPSPRSRPVRGEPRSPPNVAPTVHHSSGRHAAADGKLTLNELLSKGPEALDRMPLRAPAEEDLDAEAKTITGMCVECGDQPADRFCEQCQDDYCEVCFAAQHKRGMRKKHTVKSLKPVSKGSAAASSTNASSSGASASPEPVLEAKDDGSASPMDLDTETQDRLASSSDAATSTPAATVGSEEAHSGEWFTERTKYIPLRLSLAERKFLRLVEAAVNVSEYTDKVDIISFRDSKPKRIFEQIKDVCAILSGLVVASDYQEGQKMVVDRNFDDNEKFFQDIFELARRHKIRNPEKMRTGYGKLLYLLMDSQIPEIKEMLGFACARKIHTVHDYLSERGALNVLRDPRLVIGTREIIPDGKQRHQIDRELKAKERAVDALCREFASSRISSEEIRQCIGSINDNHNYLRMNRDPIDEIIHYLKHYFQPAEFEHGFSLAIVGGRSGARLTHSHTTQYYYVLQSLTLWREICHDMFRLWYLAEEDCLDESNPYRLRDTGQGLNRVQSAPRVGRAISHILHRVQQKVGNWVGSSVVHLGDHNVPNAFFFIDKYNQVPRILNPIVLTLKALDRIKEKPEIFKFINDTFGGIEACRKLILCDFFRHAFDGSGADNFFDAGSCIDGRLTSAWNWCHTIDKKPFYSVFLLAGFSSFDGEFSG